MSHPIPEGNGFSTINGFLAWKNAESESPILVKDITDERCFANCCNAAIVWWTERMLELNRQFELFMFPNAPDAKECKEKLENARKAVSLWRNLKVNRKGE